MHVSSTTYESALGSRVTVTTDAKGIQRIAAEGVHSFFAPTGRLMHYVERVLDALDAVRLAEAAASTARRDFIDFEWALQAEVRLPVVADVPVEVG